MNNLDPSYLQRLYDRGNSHASAANILKRIHGTSSGFSLRSMKRFAKMHGLSSRPSDQNIDEVVEECIQVAGPSAGLG